jgi:hypothetical protein
VVELSVFLAIAVGDDVYFEPAIGAVALSSVDGSMLNAVYATQTEDLTAAHTRRRGQP